MLLLVAFLVNHSVRMLIECGMKAQKYDFEELAEHLLGRNGYYFALLFMFLFAYGAQVAYLVIIGDTVPKAAELLFPGTIFSDRQAILLLSATLIVLPICLCRDLSTLSWTSLLSITVDVLIVLVVFIACLTLRTHQDEHFQTSDVGEMNEDVFAGVGTMSFAFVCQHNSFMVFRSLANPTYHEWKKVAGLSVGFSCALCLGFGLIGFFTFYPYVNGDLLNNFPVSNVTIAVSRLFLAVTMVFTYPMECYVTRHCLVAFWSKFTERSADQRAQDSSAAARSSTSTMAASPGLLNSGAISHATRSIAQVADSLANTATQAVQSALHTVGLSSDSDSSTHADRSRHRGGSGKTRRHSGRGYTNVQVDAEHGHSSETAGSQGGTTAEEDVTIMFMGNKVLMMYDVSIDDEGGDNSPRDGAHHDANTAAQAGLLSKFVPAPLRNVVTRQKRADSQQALVPPIRGMVGTDHIDSSNHDHHEEASIGSGEAGGGAEGGAGTEVKYVAPSASLPVHVLLTVLLWGSSLSVALVFKQLGVVSALTGKLTPVAHVAWWKRRSYRVL
jgi:hypothetical protein